MHVLHNLLKVEKEGLFNNIWKRGHIKMLSLQVKITILIKVEI